MCGRYALIGTPEEVKAFFNLLDIARFPPRYNIAPTQPVLAVMAGPPREPGSNLPDRTSMLVRWGFIPDWAKNPKELPLLINARSETAAEKNTFRAAMRHRRTLIPASGFYEWKRSGGKPVQAYWVKPREGGLVAFGGLMETYSEPGGSEMDTGAILTTSANEAISHIHHRMPVVIRPQDFSRWLDCVNNEPRDVADLLQPVQPDFFEAIPVSDKVNKFSNTGPEIQDRVEPKTEPAKPAEKASDADQLDLF
ncbi:MAG: SOS response-associated peptidase [Rhizobiaceae bacterium]|jgi:putative SOS response-associated peptidase YedK|nr:SOS response-associated peptidase [Rhizobiaceae bacterium]